ncbi:PEP-CTERM sorting domain-containing protein [Akkermansiaceae bacterium]|nr:PEP-CTERM sorting domain-containing protein [Akkermansiaceae bacterium]
MKAKHSLSALVGIFVASCPLAHAATITWTSQGTITNENVIQANVSSAFNLSNTTTNWAVTTTVNPQTVTFASTASGAITSNGVTLTMTSGWNNQGIAPLSTIWDGTPTDADFSQVMDSFAHGPGVAAPGASATFTLSGLTNGVKYSVQLFTSDSRANIGDRRSIRFNDGNGNLTAEVAQITKQYFIGTFTASGTTQAINATSSPISPGTSGAVILNALTLSVIPEPSGAMLLGLSILGFLVRRRR